jgi:two-component system, response regulator PdtaR
MSRAPLVRILIIDDEPVVRLDARDILEDAGYVVSEAASADEAMTLLTEGKNTEAILTDINMPGTLGGL